MAAGACLYPAVDPREWARTYEINYERLEKKLAALRPCGRCATAHQIRPIAFEDMRGIEIFCPGCGVGRGAVLTPVAGSKSDTFWAGIFGRVARPPKTPKPKKRRR